MPEGPEIRRAADRIANVLSGRNLIDVEFFLPQLRGKEMDFVGAEVCGIETRGKAMLNSTLCSTAFNLFDPEFLCYTRRNS